MQRRASPQDISWFLDLESNKQLDLDPPYQRHSVWTQKDRKFFLDTIFRGYPCPAIFLSKNIDAGTGKAIYAVVDGKQRLQTILKFTRDEIAVDAAYGDDRLNGKKWSQLHIDEKRVFWDYIVSVEFLIFDPNDTQVVNQAFDRLNRNSRKLEPQELRHARWEGWFISRVESECDDPAWTKLGVVTKARQKRMKDAQFISELLLVVIEKKQHGFDQSLLDESYAKYDDVEDSESHVDEQLVADELVRLKTLLVDIDSVNGTIRRAAATLQVFYTLWVALTLNSHEFSDVVQIAPKFGEFFTRLEQLRESPDRAALVAQDTVRFKHVNEFVEGLQGASTDLAQRERRYAALQLFLRAP